MKKVVLLMAGGRGERFWPKSRASMPKQFLSLFGNESLLQQSFSRALGVTGDPNGIFVVTGGEYQDLTRSQLPELPEENIIAEPQGRNTAPAIGYASAIIENRLGDDAAIAIMPSDHVVLNEKKFCRAINHALEVAINSQQLVTIGIKPTRPEEGYGYIECGELSGESLYKARRFIEKPPLERALAFLKSGNYLWNAGIFIWRLSTFNSTVAAVAPELSRGLVKIRQLLSQGRAEEVQSEFLSLEAQSIDYALLEHAENLMVVPGEFGWDDVGTWASLERVFAKDEHENIIKGEAQVFESQGNIIDNILSDKVIVAYGIEEMIIVNAQDVMLITKKEHSSNLKKVLAELKAGDYHQLLE
jgi:mannose-1-phosphate guanylyltransferase